MKVVHWNISKRNQPMYGLKRYEDELFKNIKGLDEGLEIERIQRPDSKILGSMFASWLFTYNCKNADIVHATVLLTLPGIYFTQTTKLVVNIFDLASLKYRYKYLSPMAYIPMRIQYSLDYKALKKADRIIAASEFAKKELMTFVDIDESKIKAIYLGVDHSRYKPMDKTKCKERFGLNLGEKHVLVLASNVKLKRMDLAKRVFDDLKSKRQDLKMIKIGYSEILSGDGIINVGYIDEAEMPCLFNAADVYLHTSEYETFALPALEAMSCGVPIIVSNKPDLPEVLGHYDGLVDLDSGDCIKNFSHKILASLNRGVDYEAIKQSQNFPWRKTAEETLRLYEEVYKG